MKPINRIAQLYQMVRVSFMLGSFKSIWLQYDGQTVTSTGSCPMQIAG